MSLNSKVFPAPAENPGRIKHLYFRPLATPADREYEPFFYLEARIDFADVRSGCHMTCGIHNVLDMLLPDGDLLWTRDMVRPVDPAALLTSKPESARLRSLPDFVTESLLARVEAGYLSYLLRHAEMRIYRNFVLNAYSHPNETREEFQLRCLEVFNETFRGDLDALREVFNRRLERVEEKFLRQDLRGEFESDRKMAQARSKMHALAEKVAELFLRTRLALEEKVVRPQLPQADNLDLDQSLEGLEMDVRLEIQRLINSYQARVRNIDEYIIHPNLRDVHIVRTCILWVPVGAALP